MEQINNQNTKQINIKPNIFIMKTDKIKYMYNKNIDIKPNRLIIKICA